MAASLLSPLSVPASELVGPSVGLPKSSFLSNPTLFFLPNPRKQRLLQQRCYYKSPSASGNSLDHIPNQFRQQNLKDGCQSLSQSSYPSLLFLSLLFLLQFCFVICYVNDFQFLQSWPLFGFFFFFKNLKDIIVIY